MTFERTSDNEKKEKKNDRTRWSRFFKTQSASTLTRKL